MVTQPSDIARVFSGGSTNSDPAKSIGGSASNIPLISGNLNNLFDDITSDESAGTENYRCIYFFNDGDTPIYNCKLWIHEKVTGGSNVAIGILSSAEIQRIRFIGNPTSGEIIFRYESNEFTISFNSDLSIFATSIQDALNSLTDSSNFKLLREVTVTAQTLSGQFLIDVNYGGGQDDKKNHFLIEIVENNLDPATEVTVSVLQEGSPVNDTAELLEVETQVPNNVEFYQPNSLNPIIIPKLLPNDGFPLWIQRTIPTNLVPLENDGFILRFKADSLDYLGN